MLIFFILTITATLIIGLCRKSPKSFFVDINSQRIDPCNCYINSKIEFKVINEEGIIDIVADY